MNKKLMPYLLPLVTIIAFAIIFTIRPDVTGYTIQDPTKDLVNAKVRVFLGEENFVPVDSVIEVSLDGESSRMSLKEFIEKSGKISDVKYGELIELDYRGEGFVGEFVYDVDLSEFDLGITDKKDIHELNMKIIFNDEIILENTKFVRSE